jgi:hypothetical protein
MDYFQGITPRERYDNEILNEIRTMNKLLTELLGHHAQMPEKAEMKVHKPRGRRKGAAV